MRTAGDVRMSKSSAVKACDFSFSGDYFVSGGSDKIINMWKSNFFLSQGQEGEMYKNRISSKKKETQSKYVNEKKEKDNMDTRVQNMVLNFTSQTYQSPKVTTEENLKMLSSEEKLFRSEEKEKEKGHYQP